MKKRNPLIDLPKYFLIFNVRVKHGLYLVVVLTLLLGVLEGIGIAMFLPLFTSLLSLNQTDSSGYTLNSSPNPFSVGSEIPALQFFDVIINNSLINLLVLICLLFFLKGVMSFFALSHINKLRANLQFELKTEMLNAFCKSTFSAHGGQESGHFINVFQEQITKTLTSFNSLVTLISHLILAVIFITLVFAFHWQFGLIAIFFGAFVLVSFKFLNTKVRELSREMAMQNSSISNFALQFFWGARYLRSTASMNEVFEKRLKPLIGEVKTNQVMVGKLSALTVSAREPVAITFVLLAFFLQLSLFDESINTLLIAVAFIYRAVNMAWSVQANLQKTLENIGSLEIVDKELKFLSEREEGDEIFNKTPINSENLIDFHDVSFRHNDDGELILNSVNLSIKKGELIAITGKSGGGKSTLFDLISLLYEPSHGFVGVSGDGKPAGTLSKNDWRKRIGYLTQEPILFKGSIADNVKFCDFHNENNETITQKSVEQCLSLAGAWEFVNDLPQGVHTDVGEQGRRLSGGQRQRIALARELYKNPDLLLLDEPTSSLDAESTSIILNSLAALKGTLSIVIITHEMITLEYADEIYVIDRGHVRENGTFNELMNRKNSNLKILFEHK